MTAPRLVPFSFGSQTGPIPLSELDANLTYISGKMVSVRDEPFNAKADGSDDTAAFAAWASYCTSNNMAGFIPSGRYAIKRAGQIVFNTGFRIFGEGRRNSVVVFKPSSPGACFTIANGASRVNELHWSDFGFWSDDTTTFKVAIDGYDLSGADFENIQIDGTGGSGASAGACWSGSDSIGIRFHGREFITMRACKIVADIVVKFAANPNTARNDNEDCDHVHIDSLYGVANGNPAIYFDDDIGFSDFTLSGAQPIVGGTGAIRVNDTRSGMGLIPSRNFSWQNLRYEQCQDANAFAVSMKFLSRCESAIFVNFKLSSTSQGFDIDGIESLTFNGSAATPAGKVSLQVAGAIAASVIQNVGAYFPPGATVTLTDYFLNSCGGFNAAETEVPQNAIWTGRIGGSQFLGSFVQAQGAASDKLIIALAATGDGICLIPLAAGSGGVLEGINNSINDIAPIQVIGTTIELRYRTGVGASTRGLFIDTTGAITIPELSGVGSRTVVADASGTLSAP